MFPQTGMAHLRFDFLFNEQRKEVHANWNLLFILSFHKKREREMGLNDIFIHKTLELLGTYFFKEPWSF